MPYLLSFNDTLTNNIVSFEQLGPGIFQARDKYSLRIIFRRENIAHSS